MVCEGFSPRQKSAKQGTTAQPRWRLFLAALIPVQPAVTVPIPSFSALFDIVPAHVLREARALYQQSFQLKPRR